MEVTPAWDLLIRGALVFDGLGGAPSRHDLAVKNGHIAARGVNLPTSAAAQVVEADGQWLMPGLIDNHTHFDLEVEVAPGLPEAVRHGTTSVVMSNCSLGLAFGDLASADHPEQQPIIDCFARVENMPKRVLARCLSGRVTWDNTADYLEHLDTLPLGPSVAPMVPHSMLRIAVMGLESSISREPTENELKRMCELTEAAFQQGYIGFSSDGLPLHYLANDPHRNEKIPAQHASLKELRAIGEVVRKYDRVWQATPDPENPIKTLGMFALTSKRFRKRPLSMTATAAMDINCNRRAHKGLIGFSKLLNSRLVGGDFTFQALSAPFRVYADGVTSPLLEERPSFRELMAIDVEDVESRRELLADPEFVERFRADWRDGKDGYSLSRLRHELRMESTTFSRELRDMNMDRCPFAPWNGENLDAIFNRQQRHQNSQGREGARDTGEAQLFDEFGPLRDDADFIIALLRRFDREFRWYVVTANERPEILKDLVFHPETLPGFNDSGAHLTNMAYFDGNLVTLQIAARDSIELVALAVKRLTRDAARLFRLDAGTLDMGAPADLVLINPDALLTYDSAANTQMIHRDVFDHPQMVNRSDGVVAGVWIGGHLAWDGSVCTPALGEVKMGRPLRAVSTGIAKQAA
ncbi:MAG: hypothetical protein SV583_03050 [Pseudomonadota bacterium]|nr:hypothetical protein [Pseudomonadota bacterium]